MVVLPLDTNLRPALLKQSKYISRVLKEDHLADPSPYQQISGAKAVTNMAALMPTVEFFSKNIGINSLDNTIFIFLGHWKPTILSPIFILPPKSRRLPGRHVGMSRSVLHGLGKWKDHHQLQPICCPPTSNALII